MAYVKRPNGFRAVRMRGKTEVVYCLDKEERAKFGNMRLDEIKHGTAVCAFDGSDLGLFDAKAFKAQFASEYSPMPDAVLAMLEGKPSFAEWWDALKVQK